MKEQIEEERRVMFPTSIPIERLLLDGENPRLPEDVQGGNQSELMLALARFFDLGELADSLAQNGYFREEPIVAIPKDLPRQFARSKKKPAGKELKKLETFLHDKATEFTVVEGNRRLATCKILLDSELRRQLKLHHWPAITSKIAIGLSTLPVIVYLTRSEVVPYLGIRHIVGIQKWDSYAKARYVARLIEEGRSIEQVESSIGDKRGSARKNYVCYKILRQLEDEFDFDTQKAKNNFSYLLLAIGQGSVKRFLGIPTRWADVDLPNPVPQGKLDNLKHLASWMFGDGKLEAVIRESRDITSSLTHVLDSGEAVEQLKATRRLDDAFELTEGEEKMMVRNLKHANSRLERALGIIHRHKTPEVRAEIEKCFETVGRLKETIEETE